MSCQSTGCRYLEIPSGNSNVLEDDSAGKNSDKSYELNYSTTEFSPGFFKDYAAWHDRKGSIRKILNSEPNINLQKHVWRKDESNLGKTN